jgi:broad specificity phosphatase PhoE
LIDKELYIIRHGQTDHNLRGIVQGKGINLPLNATGLRQADAFYQAYKHIPFERIYTSTLLRAQQTAHAFRDMGIPMEIRSGLDEISWGDMEGQQQVMENSDTFKQLTESWQRGEMTNRPSGGESPLDLQARQQLVIDEIRASTDKLILISMHGRAMRSLLCTLTDTPLSRMEDFPHVNLTLYKLNLLTDGRVHIECFHDQRHLSVLDSGVE